MRRTILPSLCAGAALLACLPAGAAAQTPDPTLQLSPTKGAPPGQSLTLKARCAKACKLTPRELSVMRFDRQGGQQAGTSTIPLKGGARRIGAGKTVQMKLPLADAPGALARQLVASGEYARVHVLADFDGEGGQRQVARSVALHKPGMKKLVYADDDAALRPPAKPRSKVTRYRVTVSGIQKTDWRYNRDEAKGPGCTIVSNGSGNQTLRFKPTESVLAKLTHRPDGKPYFDTRPSTFSQLFVGGKLSVDRQGTRSAGVSGQCDGTYGGEDGGGPPPPCNGKATFDSSVMVDYIAGGQLSAFRLPTEEIMSLDRGVDCPVEMGARAGGMEMIYAVGRNADPTRAGNDPGKYIAILRGSRKEAIPGGSVTTRVTYTVTFKR
jgi:hypothetical protein